ncbi:DNA alkylation repair protein, partial [Candidatus Entotheonella palauensis]|uniref:DNA alkylation repair protein n=1 Tax=Candidatus Entotheonella palauensis TaxID=93172 RepID=UPI0011788F24
RTGPSNLLTGESYLEELGTHNPQRVIQFLNVHWALLKGVARKEATRKLDEQWLQQLSRSLP